MEITATSTITPSEPKDEVITGPPDNLWQTRLRFSHAAKIDDGFVTERLPDG
jgi:hypothetical protein